LDIKPYFDKLDAKSDANLGWVSKFDNEKHMTLHLKGIPHKH
jgi:tRNA (Thr-GGU) A37 N-methylase